MTSKIIGSILLIIGTSIGGGMLALPMATAAGGFLHSIILFLGAWAVTVIAAYYILEVNLWLPENTNMISMAHATLGKIGQAVTWLCYLFLLYSLMSAYIASGGDLLQNILANFHVHLSRWANSILFTLILGSVLFFGVHAVDIANRGLMAIKLCVYLVLIFLLAPYTHFSYLAGGHFRLLSGAVLVVITSFGYATIIPTLRTYFNSNVNALRLTIAIGSLIPLVCYLLWDMVVQGSLPAASAKGLIFMATARNATADLTNALSMLGGHTIHDLAFVFTQICVTTSFLGVSLCLSDFFADGLKIAKKGLGNWIIMAVTLLPPLAIVLINPAIFIKSLSYAGIFCVVLLMLIPALMVWSGRYVTNVAKGYQVMGGKTLIVIEIIVSLALVIVGFKSVLF